MPQKLTYEELQNKVLQQEAEIIQLKAEKTRLSEIEIYFHALMNHIKASVNIVDVNYKIQYINRIGSYGLPSGNDLSVNKVIGKQCYHLFQGRNDVCDYCAGKKAMALGERTAREVEIPFEDGESSKHPILLEASPIYTDDGKLKGFIEIASDLTEYKNLKSELARLVDISEQTRDFIATTDINQNLMYLNKAFKEFREILSESESSPQLFKSFFPEWAFQVVTKKAVPHASRYGSWEGELVLLNSRGTVVPVSVVIICHQKNFTDTTYYSYIFRDISLRKKIEEELETYQSQLESLVSERTWELQRANSELLAEISKRKRVEANYIITKNWLNNMINTINSTLIAIDLDQHITEWNARAEKMIGISFDEAFGKLLTELVPSLSHQMEHIISVLKVGNIHRTQKCTIAFGDTSLLSDITVYPIESETIIGAVIQIDDVTEKNRINEMMIQSEKMLSLGGLAAGMAHEINSPLASIAQNIQVILKRTTEEMPKNVDIARECGTDIQHISDYMQKRDVVKMLNTIRSSSKRAAEIVNNMLSFSRKGGEKQWPEHMADLLDKTIDLAGSEYDLKKKFDFRHITIQREYQPGVPLVLCESSKIQQVFFNILKNGSQAMSEKLGTTPYQPTFTLRVSHQDAMARVEIEDNGPGMDAPTKDQVFEPFFSTKSASLGTGLGLSVSHYIITENHGGDIWVESVLGVGTTFIIQLPIQGPK